MRNAPMFKWIAQDFCDMLSIDPVETAKLFRVRFHNDRRTPDCPTVVAVDLNSDGKLAKLPNVADIRLALDRIQWEMRANRMRIIKQDERFILVRDGAEFEGG